MRIARPTCTHSFLSLGHWSDSTGTWRDWCMILFHEMLIHGPKQCEGGKRILSLCHKNIVSKLGKLGPNTNSKKPSWAYVGFLCILATQWDCGDFWHHSVFTMDLCDTGLDWRTLCMDNSYHGQFKFNWKTHLKKEYIYIFLILGYLFCASVVINEISMVVWIWPISTLLHGKSPGEWYLDPSKKGRAKRVWHLDWQKQESLRRKG